jgi:hypothetical protein
MTKIDKPVTGGDHNQLHDQALVLAMLSLIKKKSGVPYYTGNYTARQEPGTVGMAIEEFQVDSGLVPPRSAPKTSTEPRGVVQMGSATWKLLLEKLPPAFRGLRSLAGVSLAYFAAPRWKLDRNINLFRVGSKNLFGHFADSVLRLFRDFYDKSGIPLVLMDDGAWRTFEQQLDLNSDSGPGETTHHYGYAVDLGFDGLEYLSPRGVRVTAERGLADLGPANKERLFLARNNTSRDLHATTKGGDLYHVQAMDDVSLDSVSSFMKLLEAFGPRRMKWSPRFKTPTDYLCDLGLGGEKYYVGTATDIWKGSRAFRIAKEDLAHALDARMKKDPSFKVSTFLGTKELPASPDGGVAEPIAEAHLAAVQALLKAEFLAAEKKWAHWKPVFYPTDARRPDNPRKLAKKSRGSQPAHAVP